MKTPSPASASHPDFIARQYEFAAHIRNPESNPAPKDIDPRRMAIYSELFYNNVEDFIANTYPVVREIMAEQAWHALLRDYFSTHKAHTPLFPQMPGEFLTYLESERTPRTEDPAFLIELAHYEWTEQALAVSDGEADWDSIYPDGDLLRRCPVISPLAWPLVYQFDVHHISVDYQPQRPPTLPTYLVVYRDRHDEIGFLEINAITYRLLELLNDNTKLNGRQALEHIAIEMQHPNPQVVIDGGIQTYLDLKQRDIILGTKK